MGSIPWAWSQLTCSEIHDSSTIRGIESQVRNVMTVTTPACAQWGSRPWVAAVSGDGS
ncbi:MAG: hypothetical protein ACRC7O_11115 [Fimbriiglobus sp.]